LIQNKPYVVLDRDGTLIVDEPYLGDPDRVKLLPGVGEGLRLMQGLGLGLVIVTNQSGVGRGLIPEPTLQRIHQRLLGLMEEEGVEACPIYYCPHLPSDSCPCRKPEPGLLYRASMDLQFDPRDSFVIGDKATDIELGRRVGAVTFLVSATERVPTAQQDETPADYVVNGVWDAAKVIARLVRV
jgi:D-glycero-D-manno-heptose 1,7-bisphosphate phosphatase